MVVAQHSHSLDGRVTMEHLRMQLCSVCFALTEVFKTSIDAEVLNPSEMQLSSETRTITSIAVTLSSKYLLGQPTLLSFFFSRFLVEAHQRVGEAGYLACAVKGTGSLRRNLVTISR